MVMADIGIKDYEKHREIACHFDDHEDAAVRCGAHCLVAHIPGFTTNHRMPPLGKCLRHIAPVAAMVNDFDCKHKKLTKTTFS
jgi:hypothetical protein